MSKTQFKELLEDMIFNSKSKAPVTPLVVKDRKLNHHTLDVLK